MKKQRRCQTHSLRYFVICILILAALIFIFTGSGCAQKEPADESEIPPHFTTYTDEANLFSISYPNDWEPALSLIEGLEESVKEVITSIQSDIPVERTHCIFIAGLPIETGYMPNVTIVVESLPGIGWTHDRMVEAEVQGIKNVVKDYRELSRDKTVVDGRTATIIASEGTFPGTPKCCTSQMLILVGKTVWVVTCTVLPEQFSTYEKDFDAVVRSLRILK